MLNLGQPFSPTSHNFCCTRSDVVHTGKKFPPCFSSLSELAPFHRRSRRRLFAWCAAGSEGAAMPWVCTPNREKFIRRALKRSRLLRALPAQSRACNGWASRSAWRGGRLQYPIDLHFISEIQTARRWTAAIVCSFCVRRCHASLRRAALLLNCSHISVSTSDGLYEGLI